MNMNGLAFMRSQEIIIYQASIEIAERNIETECFFNQCIYRFVEMCHVSKDRLM